MQILKCIQTKVSNLYLKCNGVESPDICVKHRVKIKKLSDLLTSNYFYSAISNLWRIGQLSN